MKTTFTTQGTCARSIEIETDGDIVAKVTFAGGCRGNSSGVAALVQGMPLTEVVARLKGIQCRNGTSCPDQLATALGQLLLQKAC